MPVYQYDWARTWRPLPEEDGLNGGEPSVGKVDLDEIDWEALLVDEEIEAPYEANQQSVEENLYDHPLAEYDSMGLLTLVGAAGAGKTYELERLEEALAAAGKFAERVRVRDASDGYILAKRMLNEEIRSAITKQQVVHLLVDALDESPDPRVLDRFVSQLQKLNPAERANIRLRITCRSSYYSASLDLRADLAKLGGLLKPARTLEIQPLTKSQVASAAAIRGLENPDGFVQKVLEKGLAPLSEFPGSLNLLLDLYEQNRDLPETRKEVYERGLLLRLSTAGKAHALDWAPEQIMEGVGAVAALLLISGRTFVQAGQSTNTIPDLATALHEVRQLRPLQLLSERNLAKFFKTGLFEGAANQQIPAGLIEIRLKEFAEFLAARFLALPAGENGRPPVEADLLALLAIADDPRRGVKPDLFGVAGWTATFNPDALFDHLLSTDADALLLGDPAVLSEEHRRNLVDKLADLVSARRVSPYNLRRLGLGGLKHSGIGDQVKDLLLRKSENGNLPTILGLALYAAVRAEELTPEVMAIALDVDLPLHVRNVAITSLGAAALEKHHLLVLKQLLSDDEGDPFFSLRAETTAVLFPRVLSADELFTVMTFPTTDGRRDTKVDSSFQLYLTHELPAQLDARGVGAAFEKTAPLIRGSKGYWDLGRTIDAFEDALLVRSVQLNGLSDGEELLVEVPGFSEHLLAWMRRNAHSQSRSFARIWHSSRTLRTFGLHLAAIKGKEEIGWWHLFWQDRDEIAELLPALSGREREFYTETLWQITQNLEGTPVRLNLLSDDRFRTYAAEHLGLPLDSSEDAVAEKLNQLAETWRRTNAQRIDQENRSKKDAEKVKELDVNGVIAEASDWVDVWDRLFQEILHRSNEDWTKFPNWSGLAEPQQEKALDLAHQFLAEGGPGAVWSRNWRETRRSVEVNAAGAALRLLCEHDSVPDHQRWLPTLITLALTSGASKERWQEFALAAWDLDPASAREAVIHTVIQSETEGLTNREVLAAFVKQDPVLAKCLGKALSSDDLSLEVTALCSGVLIEADLEIGMTAIAAVLERSSDPRRVGAAAVPLLQSSSDLPELWSRLAQDPQASAFLVTRLADRQFGYDEAPIHVTPEKRSILLDHAVTSFPSSARPKRPLSGSYTPTTTDNVQSWIGQQASVLVDEGEYEVLESFVERHPGYGYLAHRAWVSWRAKVAQATSWEIAELVAQLNDLNLRLVTTPHDIQRVVLESLARYQQWLDDGAIYDLWNDVRPTLLGFPAKEEGKKIPDVIVPRREEPASDHLARFLNLDLSRVIIRREVRTPKRGRTDIEVTVLGDGGREVRTIVEVKGSYHRRSADIQTELVDRYLTNNEATGVHLVFDFWTPVWSKLDKTARRNAQRMRGEALEQALQKALSTVTDRHRVEALIIRAPFPSQK